MDFVISNIQHFSLHDGPGIRTTVFLSGCPLKKRRKQHAVFYLRQINVFPVADAQSAKSRHILSKTADIFLSEVSVIRVENV